MDLEVLRRVREDVKASSPSVRYVKLGSNFSQKESSLHCFSSEISVGWVC
jgi:hypothetical protein